MKESVIEKDGIWCKSRFNCRCNGYSVMCRTNNDLERLINAASECTFNCQTSDEVIDRLIYQLNNVTYKNYITKEDLTMVGDLKDGECLSLESPEFYITIKYTYGKDNI